MQKYEIPPTWPNKKSSPHKNQPHRTPTQEVSDTAYLILFLYCLHIVLILFLYCGYKNNIRTICKQYKNNIRTAELGTSDPPVGYG